MENQLHSALLIVVMSLTTILLRFLPFWIFSGRKQIPGVILYLGDVLPSAVLGMLVIYCLKDVNFLTAPYGCPELVACMAVILMQLWKKNSLWSILTGTVVYMFLV